MNPFLIRILLGTKERTRGDVPNEGAVPWRRAGGEGRWPALVRGGSSRRRACFRRSCSRPARSDSCRSSRTTSLPSPMGDPGCSGGGPTETWPACRMPAGGYEDALFELKAPSSLHGLAEKVLLAQRKCSPVRPRPTHLPACPLPAAYVDGVRACVLQVAGAHGSASSPARRAWPHF